MLPIVLKKVIRIFYDYFLNTDKNKIHTASLIGSETLASMNFCWLPSHTPLKKIKSNKTEQSNRFSLYIRLTCIFVDKGVKWRPHPYSEFQIVSGLHLRVQEQCIFKQLLGDITSKSTCFHVGCVLSWGTLTLS